MLSAYRGHIEVVRLLLAVPGIDFNVKNVVSYSVILYCVLLHDIHQ